MSVTVSALHLHFSRMIKSNYGDCWATTEAGERLSQTKKPPSWSFDWQTEIEESGQGCENRRAAKWL